MNKQQQWAAIKEQAPETAEWLTEMHRAFGKPAGLRVELPSGLVVESGLISGHRVLNNRVD